MKKITSLIMALGVFLSLCNASFAQTAQQSKRIMSSYNQAKLAQLAETFSNNFSQDLRRAQIFAKSNNIPLEIRSDNGGRAVLHKILPDGTLIYTTTHNRGAGITVGADKLYPNGNTGLGLSLEGSSMRIGLWDGGKVLATHEIFGNNRVTNYDPGSSVNSHATHVTGTLIGSDQVANGAARGLAYKATVAAYDFNNDLGEMAVQAAAGLLLSNHSYGYATSALPTYYFGRYDEKARGLDQLLYNAPYYTVVCSAGNDRNANPALDPGNPSDDGYDLLTDMGVSKNNIVVAAVEEVENYIDQSSVVISKVSSFGPTDDGRIKPDISAKGVKTYSSTANSNTSYALNSGTSMAAPNVTGALTLLQELQNNIYGNFMKAATLKALAIHTASEAGLYPGPDYKYGWGLLNVEAGAKVILNKDFKSIIEENNLAQGASYTKTVKALGIEPLKITIVWTDPAGTLQAAGEADLDNITARLVNDLDVVLIDDENNLTYPWKLDPENYSGEATKGINNVDNVEKIELTEASGNYRIKVTHKDNLVGSSQSYSLIITGIDESQFVFTPDRSDKTFCSDAVGIYVFNYESSASYNGPTILTVEGLPTGAVGVITPSILTTDENFKLEISGLNGIDPGQYALTLKAAGPGITRTRSLVMRVDSAFPIGNTELLYPSNEATDIFILPTLKWSSVSGASNYSVQVSTTSNFSDLVYETSTTATALEVSGLLSTTQYYWRVQPTSSCFNAEFSSASFTTEDLNCSVQEFSSSDIPKEISLTASVITSVVNVPESILIGNIKVNMSLKHSYVSDLKVSLISPSGTEIVLMEGACGDENDVAVTFDDNGSEFTCLTSEPTVSGVRKPFTPLSGFIGENSQGDWILRVEDIYDDEGGSLTDFGITICSTNGTLGIDNSTVDGFALYPNPAKNYFEFSLYNQQKDLKVGVYDMNGRLLITKNFELQSPKKMTINTLSSGVYFVQITNGNQRGTKKLIVR